jgi:hypothetical protein
MKLTITALRTQGDECQRRAESSADRASKAEWFDLSAHCHWLAGQLERDQHADNDIEVACSEPMTVDFSPVYAA